MTLIPQVCLSEPQRITGIDIGNFWSASLEIQVGLSEWPLSRREELLKENIIMNRIDCSVGDKGSRALYCSTYGWCGDTDEHRGGLPDFDCADAPRVGSGTVARRREVAPAPKPQMFIPPQRGGLRPPAPGRLGVPGIRPGGMGVAWECGDGRI